MTITGLRVSSHCQISSSMSCSTARRTTACGVEMTRGNTSQVLEESSRLRAKWTRRVCYLSQGVTDHAFPKAHQGRQRTGYIYYLRKGRTKLDGWNCHTTEEVLSAKRYRRGTNGENRHVIALYSRLRFFSLLVPP